MLINNWSFNPCWDQLSVRIADC